MGSRLESRREEASIGPRLIWFHLLRFPPAGHPYYTEQTLQALEEQYPGWNRDGEYRPA